MGFLKNLFGGKKEKKPYVDTQGIYFYVQCDNCGTCVRLRADKQYDLERDGGQFVWHKTIVDNRCFRRIPTSVTLDSKYNVIGADISGGRYITADEYEAWLAEQARQEAEALAAAEAEAQVAEEASISAEVDDDTSE